MADDDTNDSKPEDKPAVSFATEGAFLDAVRKKTVSAEKKATEAATKAVLEQLGIDSVDGIDGIKDQIAKAAGSQTETQKVTATANKLAKELAASNARNQELGAFKTRVKKQEAMQSFAKQFRVPDDVSAYLAPLLSVDDDGNVAGPEGQAIGDVVKGLFEKHEFLKAPDFKDGPRSTDKPPTGNPPPGANGNPSDKPLSPRQAALAVAAEALAIHTKQGGGA